MARAAAQDTEPRRRLKVLDSVTRYLDTLPNGSKARVLDWVDSLVDGHAETAQGELRAMKGIAGIFSKADNETRQSVMRWLNEHYGDTGSADETNAPVQAS